MKRLLTTLLGTQPTKLHWYLLGLTLLWAALAIVLLIHVHG